MKALAKFLTVVTLLLALVGFYVFYACDISIEPHAVVVESAADQLAAFENIRYSMVVGSASMIPFQTEIVGRPDQYVFVTYTLHLKNMNLLPAEWLQIDLEPQKGDVLMLKPAVEDVLPFNEEYITLVLMTDRSAASYQRSATVRYYVYGHEFSRSIQLVAQ